MDNKINIDMNQTTEIVCEKCKNTTFVQSFYLRKLSALLSPNGKESIIPVNTFECSACGHINEEFKIHAEDIEPVSEV